MRVKVKYLFFLIPLGLMILFLALTVYYPVRLPQVSYSLPENFEEAIAESEKNLAPTPGTEKKIVWANPEKSKTRTSIIYLHGFSATSKEIAPVPELLAKKYNANLFLTRLTGHGIGTEGMHQVSVERLLLDAKEALEVGKKIGDQVVIVGTSTGAMLSLYLAHQFPDDVYAQILISPNFRPRKWEALALKGPLGGFLTESLAGKYYEFKPINEDNAKYWTSKYPTRALSEMMNLIEGINSLSLKEVRTPTLILYTEEDRVVSIDLIKKNFSKLGSPKKKLHQVLAYHHVLAGDIISPKTTHPVVGVCDDFLNGILR